MRVGTRLRKTSIVRLIAIIVAFATVIPALLLIPLQLEWQPPYDASRSYAYSFANPPAQRVPVAVSASGIELPPVSRQWDSALLRLDIEASVAGKILLPAVELHVNGARAAIQYFEPGAKGTRFVNLSALSDLSRDIAHHVHLRGQHLKWKAQQTELLLFDNAPHRKRLLVISPHPDDAEIAAFGLYSRHDSRVVTVTAGDSGGKWYDYIVPNEREHYALKARLRVWDSLTVPLLGGVKPEHAVNLGYFDDTIKQMYERPDVEARAQHLDTSDLMQFRKYNVANLDRPEAPRAVWSSLVADLTKLLVDARPEIVVMPHPVLDMDSDHAFSAVAVLEALAVANLDGVQLYLYATKPDDGDMFPFGPTTAIMGPPAWFDPKTQFWSFHSSPLNRDLQILKLFAVDTMHDIRRSTPGLEPTAKEAVRKLRAVIRKVLTDTIGGDAHNSHRRAARPNEIFFVYPASHGCALREAALSAHRLPVGTRC